MAESKQESATGAGAPKRPYVAPRLVTYGSVAKLTQGGSGAGIEGMSGMIGMN